MCAVPLEKALAEKRHLFGRLLGLNLTINELKPRGMQTVG